MSGGTKVLILDTAEKLFAEQGIDAVSLRSITTQAGVNLAAINYHFRSKELLVQEVFARRIRPLNEERLMLLENAEAKAGADPLRVEAVLRALFEPAIRLSSDPERGYIFLRICGRIWSEPSLRTSKIFDDLFEELIARFGAAFRKAIPRLPPEDMFWRTHFSVGAMLFVMTHSDILRKTSQGLCNPANVERTVTQMVHFTAAGMRAPVLVTEVDEETSEVKR
tara:strand:- start:7072 stop:7740 length:669 start_codon:yes stop_codon:yes gene_type:complete